MKKFLFSVLFLLILIPFSVDAKDYSYDVCSNCTYKDLNTVFDNINNQVFSDLDNVTVNLKDEEYVVTNGTMSNKNINLNINGSDKTKIQLKENFDFSDISGVNINNIIFTSESNVLIFQTINDLNFKNISLEKIKNNNNKVGLINIEANNVNIDKVYFKECEALNGLNILADTSNINITNSDFSNTNNGIYVVGNNTFKYQFNIDNTVLNNKDFSVISYIDTRKSKTKFMSNIDTSSSSFINITNSKLVGLKAYSDVSFSDVKGIIYADYTNTWLKEISTDTTVVSALSGKVYCDDVRKKILTMNISDKQSLNAIFGVKFSDNTMWEIQDLDVLKIEDGNIVGLKTGTTTIMTKNNLDVYTAHVTIINNPVTLSTVYITIVIILLVSFGTGIVITIKDNKSKLDDTNIKDANLVNDVIREETNINQVPIINDVTREETNINQVPIISDVVSEDSGSLDTSISNDDKSDDDIEII